MSRDAVADALAASDHAVALTGAGTSTASGVPDFRGEDGLYGEFDQSDITIGRFERDPGGFWRDWTAIHAEQFADDPVEPNPAHEALADLERAGVLDALVTQNVDGLHGAAGSESIVHLHGTAATSTCRSCGRTVDTTGAVDGLDEADYPPRCDGCDGVLKPDTVLFGEQMPLEAMREARRLAEETDVMLAVGSSLTVDPAASLPRIAGRGDATLVIVNLDETPVDSLADYVLRERVEAALPAIAERAIAEY
jgi:NAD-dependent deacetylase